MQAGLEFWAPHVAAMAQESVATAVYAKRHGLALHSLYYWRHKIKAAAMQACGSPERSSAFVALKPSRTTDITPTSDPIHFTDRKLTWTVRPMFLSKTLEYLMTMRRLLIAYRTLLSGV
jgi:hypothetical protein